MPAPAHNETTAYGFQHPDNGAAMTLKWDFDEERPTVEVDDWVLDEASPEEAAHLNKLAMQLTRVVRGIDDLHEAAKTLYREHYCKDIL